MTTQTKSIEVTGDHSPRASVSISGERLVPLVIVLAIMCGMSIGLTAFAFNAATKAETESRMLEYYLLELDAKFINAGLKDPAESIANKLKQQRERNK